MSQVARTTCVSYNAIGRISCWPCRSYSEAAAALIEATMRQIGPFAKAKSHTTVRKGIALFFRGSNFFQLSQWQCSSGERKRSKEKHSFISHNGFILQMRTEGLNKGFLSSWTKHAQRALSPIMSCGTYSSMSLRSSRTIDNFLPHHFRNFALSSRCRWLHTEDCIA